MRESGGELVDALDRAPAVWVNRAARGSARKASTIAVIMAGVTSLTMPFFA